MILLRSGVGADVAAVAALHRRSMRTAMPWLPDLHTPEDDLKFFGEMVFPSQIVTVAVRDGRLVGFAAGVDDWLNHLYVDSAHQGVGVGYALLQHVRQDKAALQLWAFQRNHSARQFYERAGFRVSRSTDGSFNEEGEPDVLYVWRR